MAPSDDDSERKPGAEASLAKVKEPGKTGADEGKGADELSLLVGHPSILVFNGKEQLVEGPALTTEDVNQLLQTIADSRHRRELRAKGTTGSIYTLCGRIPFVVRAKRDGENVSVAVQ